MVSERKFVSENIRRVLLKEYLMKHLDRAGFGGLDIQRTPMGTRVTLVTERPGLVIGRRGAAIKALTKAIEEDFAFDNPQIEVQQVDDPNLNPQIMAEKLATALERGWHFRRAGHSTVRRIMESGAKGCQVILAGKLTGQRHRTEKFREGSIKYCGEPKIQFMREGFSVAKLKPGVTGVKVQIMDPNAHLPDEVIITMAATAPADTLEAGSPGMLQVEREPGADAELEGEMDVKPEDEEKSAEPEDIEVEKETEKPAEQPADQPADQPAKESSRPEGEGEQEPEEKEEPEKVEKPSESEPKIDETAEEKEEPEKAEKPSESEPKMDETAEEKEAPESDDSSEGSEKKEG